MGLRLLELFVDFVPRGVESVSNAINKVHGEMGSLAKAANAVGAGMISVFNSAKLALAGFITAGVATSYVGEQITLRMGMISREMTAIFLPTINKVIDGMDRLLARFRALSGEQQDVIQKWALASATGLAFANVVSRIGVGPFASMMLGVGAASLVAAGGMERFLQVISNIGEALTPVLMALGKVMLPIVELVGQALLALSSVLNETTLKWAAAAAAAYAIYTNFAFFVGLIPTLINGIMSVVKAIAQLTRGMAILQALSGPKGWMTLAAGIVAAAAAVGVLKLFDSDDKVADGKSQGHRTLAPKGAAFENLQSSWQRIAMATAMMAGKPIDEQQLDVAKEQLVELRTTNMKLGNLKPAVTN